MKRKYADSRNTTYFKKKRNVITYLSSNDYKGYISLIRIDEIDNLINVEVKGRKMCLADKGYFWLRHYPDNCNYCLLTMFDNNKKVVQWYVDINTGNKVTTEGIPYYDDLYLDISILPPKDVYYLDEDELAEALTNKLITKELYEFAVCYTKRLMRNIEENQFNLIHYTSEHLEYMLDLIK